MFGVTLFVVGCDWFVLVLLFVCVVVLSCFAVLGVWFMLFGCQFVVACLICFAVCVYLCGCLCTFVCLWSYDLRLFSVPGVW